MMDLTVSHGFTLVATGVDLFRLDTLSNRTFLDITEGRKLIDAFTFMNITTTSFIRRTC